VKASGGGPRKRTFGTHEVARLCHVTPPTIGRWIEEGKLPSFKTAGGHRRVWDKDLAAFLKSHNMPVPSGLSGATRILVVDDEPEMRRLMRRLVSERFPRAEVHEAVDGFEAGHKIATLSPEVVILDLRLPGMDGYRVCRTVRADAAFKSVKILAITGAAAEEARRRVLEAGADGFLAKPFQAEDLAESLLALCPDLEGGRA
jgi:excisionase family DNA binding protein